MKIALKEADETEYWLFICQALKKYPSPEEEQIKLNSIIKILNKIVGTSKRNEHSLIR